MSTADIRFRRNVERLCKLEPRPDYELLTELGARRPIRTEIELLAERYVERLDPVVVRALGADRFAPIPLHVLDGGEQ